MSTVRKITPFLWFDDCAAAAATFYVSLFENSSVESVSDMMVTFELDGLPFMALNGGPAYAFTPAISLFVDCATQEEVDHLWGKLAEGGEELRCGWVTDRFGLTWQVVPSVLGDMLQDENDAKSSAVMQAMLQMQKLDIAALKAAYDGA